MITSRQLVLDTLNFKNYTQRAPRQLWALPWAELNHPGAIEKIEQAYPMDFTAIDGYLSDSPIINGDPYKPGRYVDEWGCVFENIMPGVIGEVKSPLVTQDDWSDSGNVHIPVELLTIDADRINADVAKTHKFTFSGCCPRPFEQLQFIRGTESLFADLMYPPAKMLEFMQKMHEYYCELLTKWCQTNVDAVNIMDDWGTQKSLLINPEIWVKIFKPLYKDYCDIAKKYGKKIFMHSDGYTLSIIPHLIEIGVDALNTQIFCIGMDKLRQFKGKITFWGEIDRQHILVDNTAQQVDAAVKSVKDALWHDGGCIAQCEFGIGAKPENVMQVYKTWADILP